MFLCKNTMGCGSSSTPAPVVERERKVTVTVLPPRSPAASSYDSADYDSPRPRSNSATRARVSLGGGGDSVSRKMGKLIGGDKDLSTNIHPAVFEATAVVITDLYNKGVVLSYDRAAEILTKYQKACQVAETHFPGSRDGKIILRQAKDIMTRKGFDRENTLFAQSVCADEINHDVNDITNLFASFLGEPFHLGGLAGIPFTGKTGFGAYAAHVPDDGHLFIMFSPHVGISESLQLGKFTRSGQIYEGHACGAAIGALNYCIEGKPIPDNAKLGASPLDYQMSYIITQVAKVVDEIVALETENERQAELTRQMFKICQNFLDGIIDMGITDLHGKPVKIAILGGIQINMPIPMADFFAPLCFQVYEEGKPPEDLLQETFFNDPVSKELLSSLQDTLS